MRKMRGERTAEMGTTLKKREARKGKKEEHEHSYQNPLELSQNLAKMAVCRRESSRRVKIMPKVSQHGAKVTSKIAPGRPSANEGGGQGRQKY